MGGILSILLASMNFGKLAAMLCPTAIFLCIGQRNLLAILLMLMAFLLRSLQDLLGSASALPGTTASSSNNGNILPFSHSSLKSKLNYMEHYSTDPNATSMVDGICQLLLDYQGAASSLVAAITLAGHVQITFCLC